MSSTSSNIKTTCRTCLPPFCVLFGGIFVTVAFVCWVFDIPDLRPWWPLPVSFFCGGLLLLLTYCIFDCCIRRKRRVAPDAEQADDHLTSSEPADDITFLPVYQEIPLPSPSVLSHGAHRTLPVARGDRQETMARTEGLGKPPSYKSIDLTEVSRNGRL